MRAGDYYSPLPLRAALLAKRARWDRPSALAGLPLDWETQRAWLAARAEHHGHELSGLPSYEQMARLGLGPGLTANDAAVAYLAVRDLNPRRYVEIGSGVSTWIVAQAARRNGLEGRPCELRVVDPWARAALRKELPEVEVVQREVQDLSPAWFSNLGEGDLLFIDSTHIVKLDGDVPHLYLEVIPHLAPGVVIHSHDIPFPRNTPHPAEQYVRDAKWPVYWTEAMLLQAFLAFNQEFRVLCSLAALRHFDEPFLAATLPGYRALEPADYATHTGSLWWERRAA